MIAIELREYKKKEKVLTILNKMYDKVLKTKAEEELTEFNNFVQFQNKNSEKKIEESKLQELKQIYMKEDIITIVDEKLLVLTYSTKQSA